MNKKPRRKAGWNIKDRRCALCGDIIPKDKCLNRHHLDYKNDIVVSLHYNCHNIVHGRVKFHHPYMIKYGKDHGCYFAAKAIINMYENNSTVKSILLQRSQNEKTP